MAFILPFKCLFFLINIPYAGIGPSGKMIAMELCCWSVNKKLGILCLDFKFLRMDLEVFYYCNLL